MYKSKLFHYTYDDYDNGKNAETMLEEILSDPELPELDEIVIGNWGDAWEDSCQKLIDGIVENKEKFSRIKSLYVGDMDFESCEVSWIIQADYSKLWGAMPQLEKIVIKGSSDLTLGTVEHENLKHLEIICGGLPTDVFAAIQNAKLPSLQTLLLYIGIDDYGFDGDISTIKDLLAKSDFPNLTYLGLTDSEIQDDVAEVVFGSKYISQITTLDLSMGTLTDKGGQVLLEKLPEYPNIKALNLEYHFLSESMMEKLEDLSGVEVNVDDQQEADEYDGEVYYYPMLTE
ncbi:MAG: cytoplasmic protein [Lachnospiraceae bacterium]|jgi:hypothetical protein|nr:cytoplasmic protein [Lachnospiraceae bacterium]